MDKSEDEINLPLSPMMTGGKALASQKLTASSFATSHCLRIRSENGPNISEIKF